MWVVTAATLDRIQDPPSEYYKENMDLLVLHHLMSCEQRALEEYWCWVFQLNDSPFTICVAEKSTPTTEQVLEPATWVFLESKCAGLSPSQSQERTRSSFLPSPHPQVFIFQAGSGRMLWSCLEIFLHQCSHPNSWSHLLRWFCRLHWHWGLAFREGELL